MWSKYGKSIIGTFVFMLVVMAVMYYYYASIA